MMHMPKNWEGESGARRRFESVFVWNNAGRNLYGSGRQSAEQIVEMDLPGYAIGGLSVDEPKEVMYEVLDECVDYLPNEKPRYLMGVGSPDGLFEGVERE